MNAVVGVVCDLTAQTIKSRATTEKECFGTVLWSPQITVEFGSIRKLSIAVPVIVGGIVNMSRSVRADCVTDKTK